MVAAHEKKNTINKCFEVICSFGDCVQFNTHAEDREEVSCHQFWCVCRDFHYYILSLLEAFYSITAVWICTVIFKLFLIVSPLSDAEGIGSSWHGWTETAATNRYENEALDYKSRSCWEDKEKAERLSSLVNAPDCWSSESVKSVLKSSPIPQSLSWGVNT